MQISIGIDEAGRGALAGPLVAAATVFDWQIIPKEVIGRFKDSKLLSPKQRKEVFTIITSNFPYHITTLDNQYIDKHGIQKANVYIVEKLLNELGVRDEVINCDYIGGAYNYRTSSHRINFYQKGESKYVEIAAASILAKVYRDNLMTELAKDYPQYNFTSHKGYGTKEHYLFLAEHGLSAIHRRSFCKRFL